MKKSLKTHSQTSKSKSFENEKQNDIVESDLFFVIKKDEKRTS